MGDATTAERVAAGIAWLDVRDPGWWREDAQGRGEPHESGPIDLGGLRMHNPCRCVLGQRWGHFGEAPIGIAEAVALGFDAEGHDRRPWGVARDYEALGAEWERVITERREHEAARVAASCCPCLGLVCEPGCTCADCPHQLAEVTDDDD